MTYSERMDKFDAALKAAASGSDVDQALVSMLADPGLDSYERVGVVAALGHTHGDSGSRALREQFAAACETFPGTTKRRRSWNRDLICACVAALTVRDGPAATGIYTAAVRHPNWIIRSYGIGALAVAGDDSAWDEIMTWLGNALQRKIRASGWTWGQVLEATEYLARHCSQDPARSTQLILMLRDHWRNLPDPGHIERCWPGIGPDGPHPGTIDLPGTHKVLPPW
ncbi:MAG TPA: hypothetical protein VMV17_02185 [Streptosporangiaceae bacterium]|nr:hypothetical protein [Streptosporangiaceae bacterium]